MKNIPIREIVTADQMRRIEHAEINSGAVTGEELMERAGRGVVDAIFRTWPDLAASRHNALVLCGPGNNGGDGFVIARLLADWGWDVQVHLFGDPGKLPPDAKRNYTAWTKIGDVEDATLPESTQDLAVRGPDLFVDALFGTGLVRPLPDSLNVWIDFAATAPDLVPGCRRVAVDLPSGLCSDSGKCLMPANAEDGDRPFGIASDLTVSFHRAKLGHYLDHPSQPGSGGPYLCGSVRVHDIGLPSVATRGAVALDSGFAHLIPKHSADHKYSNGHALVLSGGAGKTGAARLAARGALRVGAGLVTIGAPSDAMPEIAAQITALMLRRVDDSDTLSDLLEDRRFNALCLGPGLGISEATRDLAHVALKSLRPVVLDADALSAFMEDPQRLFAELNEMSILTPHMGEFARLFPDLAKALAAPATSGPAYSKVDAVREAAARAGCVVLLKGADTVIASPDGRCAVNCAYYERAVPWLATAGAGDVLAGFIAGLMARDLAAFEAADAAAWLHVECARRFGPGLIAEDIPEQVPAVFRELGF